MTRTRILIIVAAVLAVIALIAVGFLLFRKSPTAANNTTTQNNTTGGSTLPQNTTDGGNTTGTTNSTGGTGNTVDDGLVVKKVISSKVMGSTLTSDGGGLLFFSTASGQFFIADITGASPKALTETKFVNVVDVKIDPSRTHAIISFKNPNSKVSLKYFYDFGKNLAIKLNENLDTFAFSPDGAKIFYKYTDTLKNVNTFNIANANGTNWKNIKDFSLSSVLLDWIPKANKLAFHLTPSSFRQSAYYVFDQNGDNVISVLNKGYGVDGVWASDGSRLLASYAEERTINLGLVAVNIDGSERISIPNSKTFVQKCVWLSDNVSVLCAVPKSFEPRFYLPDDYLAGNFTTDDEFYRYNTKTGERIKLNLQGTAVKTETVTVPKIDAHNMFLSTDGLTLFFQNRADDDSLYRLRLDLAQ